MVRKEFAEEIEKRVKERNISKQKYIVELIKKDLNQTQTKKNKRDGKPSLF